MVHFENSSFLTTCADVMKPHSAVVRLARKHVEFVRRTVGAFLSDTRLFEITNSTYNLTTNLPGEFNLNCNCDSLL